MSGHDDVPEWAPRTPRGAGGHAARFAFLGASQPGGVPALRPDVPDAGETNAREADAGEADAGAPDAGAPDEAAFERPARATRPPGPAHAAPKPSRRYRGLPGRLRPSSRLRPPERLGGVLLGPLAVATGLALTAAGGVYLLMAGGECAGDGAVAITVAAAPDVAPAVVRAAERFNDARYRVGGRCAVARVRTDDPAAVATLLSGKGVAGVTRRPDVWIPDSSLWTRLVEGSARPSGRRLGGIASTPVVLAVPRGLATRLRGLGVPARPSWRALLAAAGSADGADRGGGGGAIPPRLIRLRIPDPDRDATGMAALVLAGALLAGDPAGGAEFTGAVRTFREGVAASVTAQFAAFGRRQGERYPVALAPEQAVFAFDARRPPEPAVAVYPAEGTVYLDHPVTVLTGDAAKADAARLLYRELSSKAARDDVQRLGFRTPDGAAPAAFSAFSANGGLDPSAPQGIAAPTATEVRRVMQSWAQLSLSIRMLSVIDVSGSMASLVAPGVTRLQSTVRTAQGGLSLLPDDSELGQWVFSTGLEGDTDWRELVSVGRLDERLGSTTRRQRVLSAFARLRAVKGGKTGLYDTVMAAFDYMKRTYKPEYVNSVLLWTDGRNEDPGGPSLAETLDYLRRSYDPERPVQVNMLGYGPGVDVQELRRIARLTNGDAYVARTPGQIQGIFLDAISRRVCEPDC